MTEEVLQIPAGMTHHELSVGDRTLDFQGRLIYGIDNDRGDRPRWAELRLYKVFVTDRDSDNYGSEIWLLYTIGHTTVYHAADGDCNRGIRVRAEDFPERAAENAEWLEPCELCSPGDWRQADPGQEFSLEITWYSYTPCATPEKVYDALRREPRCRNCRHKQHGGWRCRDCGCSSYEEADRDLSVPGRRLMEHARHLDPGIARVMDRKVKF